MRARLLGAAETDKVREAQLQLLIQQVEKEREGAFGPLSKNPVLNALAVPIGGISLVTLFQQFSGWF